MNFLITVRPSAASIFVTSSRDAKFNKLREQLCLKPTNIMSQNLIRDIIIVILADSVAVLHYLTSKSAVKKTLITSLFF